MNRTNFKFNEATYTLKLTDEPVGGAVETRKLTSTTRPVSTMDLHKWVEEMKEITKRPFVVSLTETISKKRVLESIHHPLGD